jgi:hypothetical protein
MVDQHTLKDTLQFFVGSMIAAATTTTVLRRRAVSATKASVWPSTVRRYGIRITFMTSSMFPDFA